MDVSNVQDMLKQIEEQLASVENLDPVAEQAIEALLNLIERLVAAQQELLQQVKRLKEQSENKKKAKTTAADNDANKKSSQNHSSEKQRKNLQPPPTPRADRRSFKELPIHQETECPLDPAQLPPDGSTMNSSSFKTSRSNRSTPAFGGTFTFRLRKERSIAVRSPRVTAPASSDRIYGPSSFP
jgi:uncharacterized membrane protein